jgi:predicted amidohydrolase YtcJ
VTSVVFLHARLARDGPAQDVLVAADRVSAVGTIGDLSGADEVVDLDGRFLLPGLWDHHVHFEQWAQVRARLDVSGADSARGAAHLVADHIARHEAGGDPTVVGYGFRGALWADAPQRELLDAVCPDIPVALISADLHSVWLNTVALGRFGHAGHATGLLREEVAMRVIEDLGRVADDVADASCLAAARAAAGRGVVGIVDMEKPWSLAAWRRRIVAGNCSLRVVSSVWPERFDEAVAQHLHTAEVIEGTGGLLTVGPLKVVTDGSLNTRTAYCNDAYAGDDVDARGVLLVAVDELSRLMQRAKDAGFTSAVHAIGDRANALALQAFATTGAHGSIEHAQLLDDADVVRFAQLGVIASVQPEHALDDRDVADRYWSGRTRRAFPLRSLLDAGAVLTFGSDAPVAPLDPWLAIGAAVHRTRDERPRWHAEQEITVGEALAASMPPGRRGVSITVGDVANLVVIDQDPFTVEPGVLRTMPVAATMLAGAWTHRAGI